MGLFDDLVFRYNPLIFATIVLVGMVMAVELPYRYGQEIVTKVRVKDAAWNTIYAGLLGLVAFMLALWYSQAQERFDTRRLLVVKEANAIGTTWLRADQLSPQESARFRGILTRYATIRLQAYRRPLDRTLVTRAIAQSNTDQQQLWRIASNALRAHPHDLGLSLLMQTLNDTIDVSAEQLAALRQHIPISVILVTLSLLILACVSTGLSFARMQARPAVFTAIYIAALTIVFQMAIDFDRPQTGFVHVSLDPLAAQIHSMR